MRRLIAWLILGTGACAGDGLSQLDGGTGGDSAINSPACRACAATLESRSAECSAQLEACTNNVQSYTEQHIACFRAEGGCQSGALEVAAGCHRSCGDPEQADVEHCTGGCFGDRANCAEAAIRKADGCFDQCAGASCSLCRAAGELDFDACNSTASRCADTCVRTYRKS